MKYRILESFTDKYDNSLYYVKGEVVEFAKKRAKEILEVGNLIEEYNEKAIEEVEEEIAEEETEENSEETDEEVEETEASEEETEENSEEE